jgi:hypothetical protein
MKNEPTFGERFLQACADRGDRIEFRTIIPIIEGIIRLWLHLNPRVYSLRLRIREISDGRAAAKSNKYIIFALYTRSELTPFILNLFAAVRRSGFNLVVVSSGKLNAQSKESILDSCYLLIERVNLGRDFGAYKDGLAVLMDRVSDIERLVLMNDSLFFFERGLDEIIKQLDSHHDFVGLTEVFQDHYHVQSFLLSFGSNVLQHRRFIRYWKKYRPIGTRRWSVHKGEVGLTRALTKAGFKPYILFHGAQLIELFRGRALSELLDAIGLLPTFFRAKMYSKLQDLQTEQQGQPAAPIGLLSDALKGFGSYTFDDAAMADLRDTNINWLRNMSDRAIAMDKWAVDAVWREIVSTVTTRNQMHVGGFLFMKYLGLSMVKRDILYRTVYTIEDIYEILTKFDEPLRDEVIADLRRTGTVAHFGFLRRLLHRHGSI